MAQDAGAAFVREAALHDTFPVVCLPDRLNRQPRPSFFSPFDVVQARFRIDMAAPRHRHLKTFTRKKDAEAYRVSAGYQVSRGTHTAVVRA
jgi:hypothetical protein